MVTRNETIEKVNKQKNIYKKKENVYVLRHTHDISPRPVIIKSNLSSNTMDLLVAYLQFKADELQNAYDFDQVDMADFLVKYFKCEVLQSYDGNYFEIDLYENWEYWAGESAEVGKVKHFDADGLLDDIEVLVNKIA